VAGEMVTIRALQNHLAEKAPKEDPSAPTFALAEIEAILQRLEKENKIMYRAGNIYKV
jgi:hypothetical protein